MSFNPLFTFTESFTFCKNPSDKNYLPSDSSEKFLSDCTLVKLSILDITQSPQLIKFVLPTETMLYYTLAALCSIVCAPEQYKFCDICLYSQVLLPLFRFTDQRVVRFASVLFCNIVSSLGKNDVFFFLFIK
jgi:hypothetical protein